MAVTTRAAGLWRSIADLLGRMPLRTKLISAVLALVAVALVVISSAGVFILRNDLLGPYDSNLTANTTAVGGAGSPAQRTVRYVLDGNPPQPGAQVALDWVSGRQITPVIVPSQAGLGGRSNGATLPGPAIQPNSAWLAANSGHIFTLPSQSGSGRWRVLMVPAQFIKANGAPLSGTIVLAYDVTSVYTTIGQLAGIDLLVSLAIICVLGFIVVALIRRSLRPLIDIEQTAGAIAGGDLSRRVPERDPRTEVGRLGESLNIMLSHIESAFRARSMSEAAARRSEEKTRQFVADASHELRTPLSTIRGNAEYYRQRGGLATDGNGSGRLASADLDRIMRRIEQEAARMGVLVQDMLQLAQLDQQRPLEAKPVDLLTLAADAVHDAQVMAPDRSVNLTVGSGAALLVIGDELRLRQVIGNLMTNALTHTPDGTPIDALIRPGSLGEAYRLQAEELGDNDDENHAVVLAQPVLAPAAAGQPAAVLEVADHGPGLTREQAEHVFERFYRVDHARTKGGTGLGLAIVAALVAAHGGATWVRSRPGAGATFCIALPLAPEAALASEQEAEDEEPGDDGSEVAA